MLKQILAKLQKRQRVSILWLSACSYLRSSSKFCFFFVCDAKLATRPVSQTLDQFLMWC